MPHSVLKAGGAAFDLKGSAFTILVLTLRSSDLDAVAEQLAEKVRQAPDFFHHAPLVISFGHLDEDAAERVDLALLTDIVRMQGFIPVGIAGGSEEQKKQAAALKLAALAARAGGRPPQDEDPAGEPEPEPAAEPPGREPSVIITEPVRSGQSVVIAQGDLTVLASVGSGAEIAAPGNIHVYGTLRGRAFAGCEGSQTARIFCQRLEAELLSIAGAHLVSEDFPAQLRSKAVQVRLHGGRLHVMAL
uniref:septum site-determining protein MinC n=1 Tax=Candidatus Electronema sp. TaxID=2698783 RepID=UPI0040578E66